MRSLKLLPLLATVLFVALSLRAMASGNGAISGYVKDARNQKPLIEAVVTISSAELEGAKIALTDSAGLYSVRNLPPGNYTVVFEMEGYRKFTQENIVLKKGMSLGVSFQMAREQGGKKKKVVEKLVIE